MKGVLSPRPANSRRQLARQLRMASTDNLPMNQTLEVAGPVALAALQVLDAPRKNCASHA